MRDTRMRRSISRYLADMREKNLCKGYIVMSRGRLNDFAIWMEDREVTCLSKVDAELLAEYMDTYRGLEDGPPRGAL